MWGQTGQFTINMGTMPVRIEQDGMFGVGAMHMTWPGFSAHAVDYQKPFISETGFRSFIGCHADMLPGITPDGMSIGFLAPKDFSTLVFSFVTGSNGPRGVAFGL